MASKCEWFHACVRTGTCPWCREQIGPERLAPAREEGSIKIDPVAAVACWPGLSEDNRIDFLVRLKDDAGPVHRLFPLVRLAMEDESLRRWATSPIGHWSQELSDDELCDLYHSSPGVGDDPVLQSLIIHHFAGREILSAEHRRLRQEAVCWLVKHRPHLVTIDSCAWLWFPEDREAWERARVSWLEHLSAHPTDLVLLKNAGW